jgi:DNA-binding NarL/FixJ family response regulator
LKRKILIADDHASVRRGLRALIDERSDWSVCAEAAGGLQAVEQARCHRPDVAIIDLTMPELNGVEATRRILEVSPQTRVLIFTMHEAEGLEYEAIEAGASGYLLKSEAEGSLVESVEAILRGEVCHPERRRSRSGRLTPREREVVQRIAEGLSTKEVATALGISVKTADTHRTSAMRKLSVHGVADLVRYAVRERLVQA